MTFDKLLHNIYYDVDTGYSSVKQTYEDAKAKGSTITIDDVKKWMQKQPNKQIRPYKGFNSYVAPYARYQYQIDIMDMGGQHSEYRYAIIVVDAFSKLAEAEPMRDKQTNTVYQNLRKIFEKMGYPSSIYSDDDGSFKGKVSEFFKAENINYITTLTHANIAERFIRTVKNGIADRIRNTNNKWYDMFKHVINKYNNTVHSTTQMKPVQAHKDTNRLEVKQNIQLKASYKRKYPNISVGDFVKIYKKGKGNFTSRKESVSKWSAAKYKVIKIGNDITGNKYYQLENLTRHYSRHELLLME